jgi:hypothetical protein
MRIFVAGATGAIGRRLLPLLLAGGHQVTAMTRRPDRAAGLRAAGADPVVADALDREAVLAAVTAARPEVVVHELTDLAAMRDFRKFEEGFAATTGCAPRAPTTCWPRPERPGPGGSWPRASPAGRRPGRGAGQDRGRPARPRPAGRAAAHPGRHPPSRGGRARRPGPGGPGAALRRLLRSRHLGRGRRVHARRPPPAPLPPGRGGHRGVVVHPHRRRRRGHRRRRPRRPGGSRPGWPAPWPASTAWSS